MKKRMWLILTLFISCQCDLNAADGEYAVSKISPLLLLNANAVLRLEEVQFEIISPAKAVYTNHYVITVLNENGDFWAEFYDTYDKHLKIRSIDGVLYDAAGKSLKKMKDKDAEDLSGSSGVNLIDDNRFKRHNFYYKSYPYTIEYTVVKEYNSTLFFPSWTPVPRDRISVEQSTAIIISPADYEFRYKAFNYKDAPVITQQKSAKAYTWSVKNMMAIQREPFSPMWHELVPMVIFGPTEFQVDAYKGNMASWQDFGKFIQALKAGKDVLPDHIKQKVKEITAGLTDSRQKISSLYEYLQKNTRYISIQLGIGGWQPFDAKYVAAKSYGDCKALTNYMHSLLKEVGINSYYALVRAGVNAKYITTEFPSQQFNHVILCVPMEKDSIWLECTSQTMQAGYLGDFTSDRNVLLVDENGGRMVRTPKYGFNENLGIRKVTAKVNAEGDIEAMVNTTYIAEQQDDLHGVVNGLSKDKLMEYLKEEIELATYDVRNFTYKEQKGALPSIHETLDLVASHYATVSGKRLFIMPNIITRWSRKITADENRKYDIVINNEFKDVDSTVITIPAGYSQEAIPQQVKLENKFGKYSSSIKVEGDKIIYFRHHEQYSGRFPAKDYAELSKFYEAIYKADRSRVVLVKNETATKGF